MATSFNHRRCDNVGGYVWRQRGVHHINKSNGGHNLVTNSAPDGHGLDRAMICTMVRPAQFFWCVSEWRMRGGWQVGRSGLDGRTVTCSGTGAGWVGRGRGNVGGESIHGRRVGQRTTSVRGTGGRRTRNGHRTDGWTARTANADRQTRLDTREGGTRRDARAHT